eukprot:TRINITY_DN35766_c0_g1_i1.p1 TRINITY_DN35766_c0_g1~~TRINITY_DN35766_c0_g1_i1.p1  ORF type:complete len:359 (+),score=73.33 TRINITY_DN35766_c0_g1_i1:35-1078(+)
MASLRNVAGATGEAVDSPEVFGFAPPRRRPSKEKPPSIEVPETPEVRAAEERINRGLPVLSLACPEVQDDCINRSKLSASQKASLPPPPMQSFAPSLSRISSVSSAAGLTRQASGASQTLKDEVSEMLDREFDNVDLDDVLIVEDGCDNSELLKPYLGVWNKSDGGLIGEICLDKDSCGVIVWNSIYSWQPTVVTPIPRTSGGGLTMNLQGGLYTGKLSKQGLSWSDGELWLRGETVQPASVFEPFVGVWHLSAGSEIAKVAEHGLLSWIHPDFKMAPPVQLKYCDNGNIEMALDARQVHTGCLSGSASNELRWSDGEVWLRPQSSGGADDGGNDNDDSDTKTSFQT